MQVLHYSIQPEAISVWYFIMGTQDKTCRPRYVDWAQDMLMLRSAFNTISLDVLTSCKEVSIEAYTPATALWKICIEPLIL